MEQLFTTEFLNTLLRFFICIAVNWVIVDRLYYRKAHRRDFYFTFMLISVAIFFLVYFMMGMDRGKATMPVREMTYLFLIVCLSVVHAMINIEQADPNHTADLLRLVIIDFIVVMCILLCELKLKVQQTKLVQYDRIELIKPEKYAELKADLEERLGIRILKIDVGGVDFLKDTAVLKLTYEGKGSSDVDGQFQIRKSQFRVV